MVEGSDKQWEALDLAISSCRRCPRLVEWREKIAMEKRRAYLEWDYWGKAVPGFGDPHARLVIVGLAPGAHGANRTGRMFTGNGSAVTLTAVLHRFGFANQATSMDADDGLVLNDAFLTAVGRCVPPGNRPSSEELTNCRPFLAREMRLLSSAKLVLALGRIAFTGYLKLLQEQGVKTRGMDFSHGAWYTFEPPFPSLMACYHPSRQNTQTGRLTDEMLDHIFERASQHLETV
jgi:uracil-DNA glycosylase family 4